MPQPGERKDQQRDTKIVSLFHEGKKSTEIAAAMGCTQDVVTGCLRRNGLRYGQISEKEQVKENTIKALAHSGLTGAEIARTLQTDTAIVSTVLNLPEENSQGVTPSIAALRNEKEAWRRMFKGEARILLLFDPHIPHIYRPALDDALKAEGQFDLAIIGGDELDNVRYSRFRPDEAESVVDELIMAAHVEDAIRQRVSMVWKIRGNHDERLRKIILDNLTNVLPRMHKDAQKHMMSAIDGLERMHHDRKKEGILYHAHHWVMTGSEERPNVIAHPDRYTRAKYATVSAFSNGLRERNFNPGSVCIGHLHRYGPWVPVSGVWLAEMPAMCQRLPYMEQASAGDQPHHTGYGVIVQDKHGRFVPNKSYVHFTAQL